MFLIVLRRAISRLRLLCSVVWILMTWLGMIRTWLECRFTRRSRRVRWMVLLRRRLKASVV